MTDYGSAFTFFFKDRDWFHKFAVATLLTFSILGLGPVLGWTLELVRRIRAGEGTELPGWTDWRIYWKQGFKYWTVNLLWLLPVIFGILLIYLPLLFTRSFSDELVLIIFFSVLCCDTVFLLIYSTAIVFFQPAMLGILAVTGSVRAAASPVNVWKTVHRHPGPHLIVFLIVGMGLLTVVFLIAPLTLFLGLPPLLVYTGIVTAYYAGQLARE
jgi:Protein of unknown function (DUF4013)